MSEDIKKGGISRRDFIKDATLIAGSAAISSSLALAGSVQTAAAQTAPTPVEQAPQPAFPTTIPSTLLSFTHLTTSSSFMA